MKKQFLLFLFLVVASAGSYAQSVNDYKYVMVPSRFKFQKTQNEYGLNAITKGLLQKYGFVAYLDNETMPNEVLDYNCNKLYVDILENNNITNTKLTIVLKDCKNNILFTSAEGKSREKDWRVGYNMALRDAFNSFDGLRYKYNGSVTSIGREVIKTTNDGTTVIKETLPVITTAEAMTVAGKDVLYAQQSANGFQLVDSTPKVVFRLFKTSAKEIYLAEKDQKKGVVSNNNGLWTFDYYENGQLFSETLNIKF